MKMNLGDVLNRIGSADQQDMNIIIEAVIHRCDCLNDDCETVFLSLSKRNFENRQMQLKTIYDFLLNAGEKAEMK